MLTSRRAQFLREPGTEIQALRPQHKSYTEWYHKPSLNYSIQKSNEHFQQPLLVAISRQCIRLLADILKIAKYWLINLPGRYFILSLLCFTLALFST